MEENTTILERVKTFIFPNLKVSLSKQETDIADVAMIIFFAQRVFTYVLVSVFGSVGSPILIGLLGILYLIALLKRVKRKNTSALAIFSTVVLVLIALTFISILRFPELKFWIFGSEWNLLTQMLDLRGAISGLLLVLLVNNPKRIFRNVLASAFLNFAYLLLQATFFMISGNWDSYYTFSHRGLSYNMSFGYEMIFAVIVILTFAILKKSLILLIISALGFSFALFYGSRGILIAFLAYVFLALVFVVGGTWKIDRYSLKEKGKTALLFFLMVGVGFILIINIPVLQSNIKVLVNNQIERKYEAETALVTPAPNGTIIDTTTTESITINDNYEAETALVTPAPNGTSNDTTTTESITINDNEELSPNVEEADDDSSRTIDAIVEGNLLDDNARFSMWRLSFESFLENPLTGKGIYGDRLAVGYEFNWGYSHNIVFELMVQFGVWGIILLLLMITLVVKIWLRNDDVVTSLIALILMAMCAILLVSDSYLINKYFWSLLALLFVYRKADDISLKKQKILLIFTGALALISATIFLISDYSQQTFKTIEFEDPTVLISVQQTDPNIKDIQEMIENYGFKSTLFMNGQDIDVGNSATKLLTANDIVELRKDGWEIEDGEYIYQNPYIRPYTVQIENRAKSYALFDSLGLPEPRSYAPPFGANNSTVKYRSMDQYSFIQVSSDNHGVPFKEITYPRALDVPAMRLYWENSTEKNTIINYLQRAKDNGGLAILYIDSSTFSKEQIKTVFDIILELEFVSTSYKELYESAYIHDIDLGLNNYLENTFIANILSLSE